MPEDSDAAATAEPSPPGRIHPYSQQRLQALRFLVFAKIKAGDINQAKLGQQVRPADSRRKVSEFLNKDGEGEAVRQESFPKYAEWVLRTAKTDQQPEYLRSLFEAVYTAEAVEKLYPPKPPVKAAVASAPVPGHRGIIRDPVVIRRNSGYAEDNDSMRSDEDGFIRYAGLSFLLRPSNEDAHDAEKHGESISVSLLNILPEYVDRGEHHPMFRLRQRTSVGGAIDLEGIVLCQSDRLVLSGRERRSKFNMLATFPFNEDDARYFRDPDSSGATASVWGVMLGLSNSKAAFAANFRLFGIPDGVLAEDKVEDEKALKAFTKLYNTARAATGVYTASAAAKAMKPFNVEVDESEIRLLIERSRRQVLFTTGR